MGSLLKRADLAEVIHAGDPDRERQLLVDEVLAYFKNHKLTKRYWVSAQDLIVSCRTGAIFCITLRYLSR